MTQVLEPEVQEGTITDDELRELFSRELECEQPLHGSAYPHLGENLGGATHRITGAACVHLNGLCCLPWATVAAHFIMEQPKQGIQCGICKVITYPVNCSLIKID